MLFLIGLGLDKGDISEKGLQTIKRASKLFIDPYTNLVSDDYIIYLEEKTGKKVEKLSRSDLEENAIKIVDLAKNEDVAVLVSGDPLIATTHHTILDLAKSKNVEAKVIHSSSIFSAAIGESGLDIYRFGPTTTIPFWSEKYKPVSFIDVIKRNIDNNEHTLVLLDYNYKEKKPMPIEEAISLLQKAEEQRGINLIKKILVLADLGKEDQKIFFGTIEAILSKKEILKGKVISIIIPSNPNFAEEEALSKYSISNI